MSRFQFTLISQSDYFKAQKRLGKKLFPGSTNTYWVQFEGRSLIRRPVFATNVPTAKEVRSSLLRMFAPVASFIIPPKKGQDCNSWLYLLRKEDYSPSRLPAPVRRNLKKAMSSLSFKFLPSQVLIEKGFPSFRDTRTRAGLSDGTEDTFFSNFKGFQSVPGQYAIGAFRDNDLAGFLTVVAVETWIEFGLYSANPFLEFRPNNGLIHYAIDFFFSQSSVRIASYGLSSIQEVSNAEGLHRFKCQNGFEAVPVSRQFVFHPLVKPFIHASKPFLSLLLESFPSNRALKKASGIITHTIRIEEPDA